MNEIIFQPLFHESDKPVGYFLSMDFFGMKGYIVEFGRCPTISHPLWRSRIMDDFFIEIHNHIIEIGNEDEMLLSEQDREIYKMDDEFMQYFKENLDVADLYIYSHTPTKPGGYVRVLTAPDESEVGKLKVHFTDFYPDSVKNAGPVEKFLYPNTDEWEQKYRLPDSIKKDFDKYCWKYGDNLEFDPDIIWLYFNDVVGWNELYWDLRHAIGRPWKGSDFIEAWRGDVFGENEKKLVAEHDAQRLLFWTLENEYTLDELRRMVTEKRILTKSILGTKQDSLMILQYAI